MAETPDREFIEELRAAVSAYLDAVDAWEAAYRRFYRMPGHAATISSDLLGEQREFDARRRDLERLLPRARQLCHQHQIRNPLPVLVRTSLFAGGAPQRTGSTVSRTERNAAAACLSALADATSGFATPSVPDAPPEPRPAPERKPVDRRAALAIVVCAGLAAPIGIQAWLAARNAPAAPPPPPPRPRPRPHPHLPNGTFYRIDGRPMTKWGDYGDILQHGMTAHLERFQGLLSLERTGPYMPPITFPGIGDVVLNAACRKLLEQSDLTGFDFRPVHKARIVELAWEKWNLSANRPPVYPDSGEPEDYILEARPSSAAERGLGDVWELVVAPTAQMDREGKLDRSTWNGDDLFRGGTYGSVLVTGRAKAWFESNLPAFTRFEEFPAR